MTDPVRRSPRPDIAPELPDEEKTNPRIKRSNYLTRLVSLGVAGGFSVVTLASVAVAYDKLDQRARDAGAEAAHQVVGDVDAVKRAVGVVDADLQQHKAESAQQNLEVKSELHDVRVELRELYKAQMEGKRSEQLERPVPPIDGGHR